MAPSPPRLRILSVGGNAVSAFLSWRLQTTNSCDVTLVWKSGFESVAQYGVSFRSKTFGNERFKPRHVVRTPEEAASRESAYDYVILCVKALPDVYDLGSVIESVVTPQHTCILVNTTNTLGVESHLEQRFPTNVVLSLVSNVSISQTGTSDFEHEGSTEMYVGPANKNASIPVAIQHDMASALAMTLSSGQVECKVSSNIMQEQFDRMIGPIAFHPASVLFNTPVHSQLLEKVGVRQLVNDVIDELVKLASTQGCSFGTGYREKTIEKMIAPSDTQSTMYQDFTARRPMEVETYLGSPVRLAMESNTNLPRIETLYAMLHHLNIVNQTKPLQSETSVPAITSQPPPRTSSVPPVQKPMVNGMRASRTSANMGMPMPPPQQRRGPPSGGPMLRPPSSQAGSSRMPRDASFDDNGLEEFSHLVVYDDIPSDGMSNGNMDMPNGSNIALRERELALRQRELQLREREMNMRRGPGGPRGSHRPPPPQSVFDEEDEDDYVDPMDFQPPPPGIDPDNIDMMSVTSRRTKKAPSVGQLRRNPEMSMGPPSARPSSSFNRFFNGRGGRKSTSSRLIQDIPLSHTSILDDPLMAYSSNRYGNVDRTELHIDSRANSLSNVSRVGDFGPGPYPPSRRTSASPAAFAPNGRGMPRPGPGEHQHSYGPPPNGMMPPHGRPSPPNMRAPVPRYPPGHGNTMAAQQVEQHLGVSNSYPVKNSPNVRSLTGSASASAESGDSGASANIDSENSAHSSQTSLAHPMPMLVR